MDLKLSKTQALVLYTLLFHVGEEPTESEFKAKFKKNPNEHKQLFDTKLVESFTKPRGKKPRVKLSEKGWGWAEENLGTALNPRSPAGTKALQVLLGKLKVYIATKNLRLADLLSAKPISVSTLREAIRNAYLQLSGGSFGNTIALADLGKAVGHISREDFLKLIMDLHNEGKVFFTGNDDPLDITDQDRLYAVSLLDKHRYNVAFNE